MKISDLVRESDVPLATVKFYIREGLLPAGDATGARRAEYDERHLSRLRLIRSLTVVAGLPLSRTKSILDTIDHPDGDMYETLGRAISALAADPHADAHSAHGARYAEDALAALGDEYHASDARMEAFTQLGEALRAAAVCGLSIDAELIRSYGHHAMEIARAEFTRMPPAPEAAVEYSILGTVLYEPVIAALRRLAHQNLAADLR